mmetsp:Transcript_104103/g.204185  ORF Transcript_104103/g.204185 Transcript_104103/m.204185 type:complete len:82 (+) Transcript_104103:98-343(+)
MALSAEDVAMHCVETDCWVIVGGEVWDVTAFLLLHPGGFRTIMDFAGKDATGEFSILHDPSAIKKHGLDPGVIKAMGKLKK